MHNRLFVLASVLLIVVVAAVPASAGYTWCITDPNIQLPDGGVLHLLVGMPQEFVKTPRTLDVWAPAGARVVGNTHGTTVNLHEGPGRQLRAVADVHFPLQLVVRFRGDILAPGPAIFEDGSGSVTWTW
jgi:hypothetical protein